MHPVYEYIVAVVILFLVLSYSFYALNTTIANKISLVREGQLKDVANRLFNKILYTPGYPYNWGSDIYINESNLKDFGLHTIAGDLQKVDIDKLTRLKYDFNGVINPLYIPPETVGRLLGIYKDGYWLYGFRLIIQSALNITIKHESDYGLPLKYSIEIVDYVGKKASNALVKGSLFAVYLIKTQNNNITIDYVRCNSINITDISGNTIITFNNPDIPNNALNVTYILLVTANYYGLQSQAIEVINETVNLVNIGNYLIVDLNDLDLSSKNITNIVAIEFTTDLNIVLNPVMNVTDKLDSLINKDEFNYQIYKLTNPITEDIIFTGLFIATSKSTHLFFAPRPRTPLALDYRTHLFPVAGLKTETVYGLFRISDNVYYAQLTVWRMSE